MIYLASPYSHPDPAVVKYRYQATRSQLAKMLDAGVYVYSPVVHFHHVAKHHELPTDAKFWSNHNRHMLNLANRMDVLCLDGWEESAGVGEELGWAKEFRIPVRLIELPPPDPILLEVVKRMEEQHKELNKCQSCGGYMAPGNNRSFCFDCS